MKASVRVRFAPSPTGHLHIGNARTAILNWLYARHSGGSFILRIEDTDAERSTRESENSIYEDLRWLGLDWDEGPETGGAFGPYRQSERLALYQEYAGQLLAAQKAYYCFCREEELEAEREAIKSEGGQYRYSGKCRLLTPAQQQALRERGMVPAIRFHVPARAFSFVDLARGELHFPANAFGDFVIVRSGGLPTYNFACVVDDHLMQISHVIRGDDHVINTPKQMALYEAFGWSAPQFCHIPMILGEDRSRLSKRHGATSLDQFAAKGYLPQALINFLSLLSWSSPSGEEILSIEQLVREFDFSRLNKSPAVFDTVKLNWMNGVYLRRLTPEQLLQASIPFLQKAGFKLPASEVLQRMLALIQESLEYLAQVVEKLEFFFVERVRITEGQAIALTQTEASEKVYWSFLRQLELQETLTAEAFRKMMKVVNKETGVMGKDLWMPIRVALTGNLHGPDLATIVEILGKQEVRRRILQLVE
ncbi:MAG: glutamate--tRNA ligase [candidate division KSB1 bacterium]|nr:glutamate--tRNA ligase [candidate division KSB1 bacterium]MDZ7272829.1 glutamate--tRNA ligase [candidate division KSB1 bacterium]MDZ7284148.1 glutamate--tRNA ligase [candidate division KSB1 bacterium]MDZ7297454.1 glutamate--tRNA ligase [candidate division KSB1 bacterium]MDZ7305590.1 glutamate--tRNA ligase [candidate division KSB1 bacterium]